MQALTSPEATAAVFRQGAVFLALGVEVVAVLVIAFGAGQAVVGLFKPPPGDGHRFSGQKRVWLRFGMWLLLGLEFTLAADVIRTAIAPTWNEIGMLAAIAAIRTFLNYFLERDVEKLAGGSETSAES